MGGPDSNLPEKPPGSPFSMAPNGKDVSPPDERFDAGFVSSKSLLSSWAIKMLAYEGAILVPIAVPWTWR